jgi:hypothetical protein
MAQEASRSAVRADLLSPRSSLAAICHATAGAPTCTHEQIQERIAICRSCEHFSSDPYKPEIGACSQCGCPASDRLPKFVSKLAWADPPAQQRLRGDSGRYCLIWPRVYAANLVFEILDFRALEIH